MAVKGILLDVLVVHLTLMDVTCLVTSVLMVDVVVLPVVTGHRIATLLMSAVEHLETIMVTL